MTRWLWRVALALGVAVLCSCVLLTRLVTGGERAMQDSDEAFDAGEVALAAQHARRAATSYVPGAPHVSLAYERLRAVAVGAEAAGKPQIARSAWGAMRAAAIETRHLYTPAAAELAEADEHLLRLAAAEIGNAEAAAPERATPPRRPREIHGSSAWALVLFGSMLALAFGAALTTGRGGGARGRFTGRAAWGLAVSAAGAVAWVCAVWSL
jgi:hypothetical protein